MLLSQSYCNNSGKTALFVYVLILMKLNIPVEISNSYFHVQCTCTTYLSLGCYM